MSIGTQELAPNLQVLALGSNVGVLRRNGRVLLVNGLAPEVLRSAGVDGVHTVLITHHHRTAAEGVRALADAGARVLAPEAERWLLDGPRRFWEADGLYRVHAYNFHPSPRTVREPISGVEGLQDGDVMDWEGVRVTALHTPGPTDGGMTYLLEVGARKVAFIGGLLSAPGRLRDFHSLQGTRPLPDGGQMMEYHGFGDRAEQVLASLERVLQAGATVLVPSHGVVMDDPRSAVDQLRRNVQACLRNYYSISAARWYFAGVRPEWPADTTPLRARLRLLPPWVAELGGTTRGLLAESGQVLLMDCCGDIPQQLRDRQARGALGPAEALWITHYHDDHVGSANVLREQQGCPTIAHETMEDILTRPDAYLMPCLDPNPVDVDRVTRDGDTWEWRGFRLTAYSLPGQSLFDAALLAERGGESVLFVGDSFGPGGIDDYCAQNRNLLGPGLGFDRCLALLERMPEGCLLVNPHVEGAFAYTAEEIAAMRAALRERRELFARLIEWDDPNYGLDPQWVRCDPYRQVTRPGHRVEWLVCVTNYSAEAKEAKAWLRAPAGWPVVHGEAAMRLAPGREGQLRLAARVPGAASAGRHVVGFVLEYGGRLLGETAEGLVDVEA